ncbi:MAG: hypothetical protein Q9227_005713 [Pyrenula ochraceoflavens]
MCDEAKPTCNRCQKARRTCLGYRPATDVYFRNETKSTERRVRRDLERWSPIDTIFPSKRYRPTTSLDYLGFVRPDENRPFLAIVQESLFPSQESVALKFFFEGVDRTPADHESRTGYLDILPSIYANSAADSALPAVTAAIALGTLGASLRRPECFAEAGKQYTKAIALANAAIQDPELAKKDETLMTVLLFALFEGVHTTGAIAIVKYRGKQMFETETSRKLYLAVQQNMPLDSLMVTIYEVPTLRAQALDLLGKERSPENDKAVRGLIRACKAMDQALIAWPKTLDESWIPTTVSRIPSPDDLSSVEWEREAAWPGDIDSYADPWTSHVWAAWRNSRIFISAIIIRSYLWIAGQPIDVATKTAETERHADFLEAREVLQQMVDNTCASIPLQIARIERNDADPIEFLASYSDFSKRSTTDDTNASPSDHKPSRPLNCDIISRPLGGYYLLWPLFVASGVITVSPYQRQWIRGRLLHIGRGFGIRGAEMMASLHKHLKEEGRPVFVYGMPKKAAWAKQSETNPGNSEHKGVWSGVWSNLEKIRKNS